MALKIHLEVSLSTTSTHNSGWNRLESKDLSITLAQGFLLYTRSNMEPYDKVDSGKCSSWLLLFKAKENLAGVMMMPNQRGIIQPRPLTQVSQRHRRGRKLESFWKIFADKLNKTNTCSKDSPPLLSTGVFFFFFLCDSWNQRIYLMIMRGASWDGGRHRVWSLSNLSFLLCENICSYLSYFQLFFSAIYNRWSTLLRSCR